MSRSDQWKPDPAWLAAEATIDERERAYDLTLRGLERQTQILSDLRNRTATVLAAAGVTAALFAQKALTTTVPGTAEGLYIAGGVALVILVGLCWAILRSLDDDVERDVANYCAARGNGWPESFDTAGRKWRTTVNLDGLLRLRQINRIDGALTQGEKSLIELTVFLAHWRKINYDTIEERTKYFNWAAAFFVLQVGFGILGLTQN